MAVVTRNVVTSPSASPRSGRWRRRLTLASACVKGIQEQVDDATVNLGPAPVVPVVPAEVAGEKKVLAPAPPAVLPAAAAEPPRTGSRELPRQVLLALGLVLAGATFRLFTRRRFYSA